MYGFSTEEVFNQHQRDVANGDIDRSSGLVHPATHRESHPIVTEYADMMVLLQALAQLNGTSKESAQALFEECGDYEELLEAKHGELEDGHPTFSSVIESWVQTELQKRPEHLRESNMEIAITYDELKDEMYQDYEDSVMRNPEAAAEWQAIETILDNRIQYHVLEDVKQLIRSKFDLAA